MAAVTAGITDMAAVTAVITAMAAVITDMAVDTAVITDMAVDTTDMAPTITVVAVTAEPTRIPAVITDRTTMEAEDQAVTRKERIIMQTPIRNTRSRKNELCIIEESLLKTMNYSVLINWN